MHPVHWTTAYTDLSIHLFLAGNMTDEKTGRGWKLVQVIGVIVALIGLVYLTYSLYLLTTVTVIVHLPFIPNTSGPLSLNSGYNPWAGCSFDPLGIYGGVFSGILMILLGIMTFLCGRARMQP